MNNEVKIGQEYADLRTRGDGHNPRVVEVVEMGLTQARIKNNATGRHVWVFKYRLLSPYRFKLVKEVGALAEKPSEAVPV